MGSYINFKNFGATTQPEGSMHAGNFPLARQSSIYSLTFEELQNTLDGVGKDFGSMNMDELLKNIWTAEGAQSMATLNDVGKGSVVPTGDLHRQGSLTLPRTLSQKTVDEVWRDLLKESDNVKNGSGRVHLPEKEPTLSEITLEEFLSRAGVVGETSHPVGGPYDGEFYSGVSQQNNSNVSWPFEFQQQLKGDQSRNQVIENSSAVPNLYSNLALNAHSVIPQQKLPKQQQQKEQQQHRQQQPLLPKQVTLAFASPMDAGINAQLISHVTRGPNVGMGDPSTNSSATQSRVTQSAAMSLASLAPRVAIPAGSPRTPLTSNNTPKSYVDTSSLSSSPYTFNEGARGRKTGGFEKVVERRQKRMIKNRESAARSRARKQAYTMELEAEVAKLKELNEDMQKKQEELMEMQKSQVLEKLKLPWGSKRLCLRRTLTGPW